MNSVAEQKAYLELETFFTGQTSAESFQATLTQMTEREVTVEEVVGYARCMRDHMITVDLPKPLLDVCGTGGSGQERFNISTASAIWLGKMGVPVAKHGNYGSKKPNGSFNFLEALDIPFALDSEGVESQFKSQGYCFIFARAFHPAMKALGPIRQAIGKRTIFNLLGPLCNPAGVTHQVIGASNFDEAEILAQAIQILEIERALIILGSNDLDEFELEGDHFIWDVNGKKIKRGIENPYFIQELSTIDYPKGDSKQNAETYNQVMSLPQYDKKVHPLIHHIALNVGAGLYCFGRAGGFEEGYRMALSRSINMK